MIGVSLLVGGYFTVQRIASAKAVSSAHQTDASQRYSVQTPPLSQLVQKVSSKSAGSNSSLIVNGQLTATNSIVLEPTARPAIAVPGQIYFDQASSQLGYYNGSVFVYLQGGSSNATNNVTNITNVLGGGSSSNAGAISGGAGSIAVFTGVGSIGKSLLSQSGSTISVAGSMNLQGGNYEINGTPIASGDLADASNLAMLDVSQTFTGSNTFKSSSNSTSAFQIQNASGTNMLTIDTTNNEVVLGADGANPSAPTIRGGAAVGNNLIGANLHIAAPDGTGVGGSGDIVFDTAGGVSNPLVSVDAVSGAQQGISNATVTWSHTTGSQSDRILIVTVDSASTTPPSTVTNVTYNGVALSELTSVLGETQFSSHANGSVWYMVNPPSGAHQVAVSLSGTPSDIGASSVTFYNVDQTTPIASFTTDKVIGSSVTTTLSGTNGGEGIFDALMARASIGNTITPGPGQTPLYGLGFFSDINYGSFRQGNAGSTTMSWAGNGAGSDINHIVMALNPEPNLTPDPLTEALRITQSGTLGVDLTNGEDAISSLTFGGNADRNISVNQNPGTGAGHSLSIQAGSGATGANNGGDLILQGGAATGSGTGGGVIVKAQTDSAKVFQIQSANGTPLLVADSTGMTVSITGTTSSYGTLLLNNARLSSTQTTAPTISIPANCGTGATATITSQSTDTAGSFTINVGSGSPTTCSTAVTYNQGYNSTPKSIILTPTTAFGGVAAPVAQVSGPTTSSFTAQIAPTNADPGATYSYYYLVVE